MTVCQQFIGDGEYGELLEANNPDKLIKQITNILYRDEYMVEKSDILCDKTKPISEQPEEIWW